MYQPTSCSGKDVIIPVKFFGNELVIIPILKDKSNVSSTTVYLGAVGEGMQGLHKMQDLKEQE
jgi:hypothetical protein